MSNVFSQLENTSYFTRSEELFLMPAEHDIQQLINGNQKAFAALFDVTHRNLFYRVYKIVRSEAIANDIVQDAYLKFWEKRNDLKTDGNPEALLSTIAVRLSIDQYRKDKRQAVQTLEADHWQQIPEQNSTPNDPSELKEKIATAIEQLPPKRKLIFRLCKEENLTYKEIASHMDISVKTVENQMSKAFQQLRHLLRSPVFSLIGLSFFVLQLFFEPRIGVGFF